MLKKTMKFLPLFAALILLAVFLPKSAHAAQVKINSTNFPDQSLRDAVSGYDYDSNGYLSDAELQDIQELWLDEYDITTLKGIELLPNLMMLSASYNKLSSVDVSHNTELFTLSLSGNSLTSIDLSNNDNLEYLYLGENKLSSIDLSGKNNLRGLDVSFNKIKKLELYNCLCLNSLYCGGNLLTDLNLTNQQSLEELSCEANRLTALDLKGNLDITYLNCCENSISSLALSNYHSLVTLDVSDNKLISLDLTNQPLLEYLYVGWNELSALNITKNPRLMSLNLMGNNITSLNISCCPTICYTYETGTMEDLDDAVVYEVGDPDHWELGYYTFSVDKKVKIKTASASLAAPTLKAVNKPDRIALTWNAVPGADSYEIWRMKEGGVYEKLKTSTGTAFNDKSAKPGVVYYYRMRAMAGTKSGSFCTPKKVTRNPFSDVTQSNSYFDSVMWAVRNNVVSGTTATTFSPADSCTRYQFAVMIYRMLGKPDYYINSLPFKDVPTSASYYNAVAWAYSNGIISGTTKTTFSPNAPITRYQVVQMLYKLVGKPDVETSTNPFKDVSKKASYYKAVLWAVENRITAGTSAGHFSPNAPCQRYQMTVFLRKLNNLMMYIWE